jgi:hypothetical protein
MSKENRQIAFGHPGARHSLSGVRVAGYFHIVIPDEVFPSDEVHAVNLGVNRKYFDHPAKLSR